MRDLSSIKQEIEIIRTHLNMAIKHKADREYILVISKMLDNLIYEYYAIQDKKENNLLK